MQLFFQTESAHNCINELGHLGLVQFKDVSNLVVLVCVCVCLFSTVKWPLDMLLNQMTLFEHH